MARCTGVASLAAQSGDAPPWRPDNGDGTFKNPVLHADYSDPDAVRVGDDYYHGVVEFTAVPGLPILHSSDLVNWDLVNHALPRLVPEARLRARRSTAPASGRRRSAITTAGTGSTTPIPTHGIYVTTATDPRGDWSAADARESRARG